MSSDHQRRNGVSEVGDGDVPGIGHNGPPSEISDPEYWHALIDENVAAEFCDVTTRSMQKFRQTGEGPPFVRISSRCIKYTRFNCRTVMTTSVATACPKSATFRVSVITVRPAR